MSGVEFNLFYCFHTNTQMEFILKPRVFPRFRAIFPTVEELSPQGAHQALQATRTTLKGTGNLARVTKGRGTRYRAMLDQGC